LGHGERSVLIRSLTIITLICFGLSVLLAGRIINDRVQSHKAAVGFSMSDYQTALELQGKVGRLRYEK
jgi:hypothetical protein